MNSRYLLGPTNSPPDLRNHYCGRGYYSPSNRPQAGLPSLRSEQIHPARYCASTVRVRDLAVARWDAHLFGPATRFHELCGLEHGPAFVWSRLSCLLVFISSTGCTAEELIFPRSNSFSKHKLLLWKGMVSQCYYPK